VRAEKTHLLLKQDNCISERDVMKKSPLILLLALLIVGMGWYSSRSAENREGSSGRARERRNSADTDGLVERMRRKLLPTPLRGSLEPQEARLTIPGTIEQTNSFRRQKGLPPLREDETLSSAAEAKLDHMFSREYFAHDAPSGEGVDFWLDRSGYKHVAVGENLALGNYEDDAQLVQGWMNSQGHRENILNPLFTEIGVAVGRGEFEGADTWMAVQIFAKPESACPHIDQSLKNQIEQLQEELEELEYHLNEMRARLEKERPAGRATRRELADYNELVNEYNRLVAKQNELADSLRQKIDVYNRQVSGFNECAGG